MSDHISGPRALADPIADITDVYAFPSPERPDKLVLVLNTLPFAKPSDAFSDGLVYRFRLRPLTATRRTSRRRSASAGQNSCSTACSPLRYALSGRPRAEQEGTCTAPTGETVSVRVNDEQGSSANGVRVFAGPRWDPFIMDAPAALKTIATGKLAFTDPGSIFLDGKNVLSLVVEVDRALLNGAEMVGVVAETLTRGSFNVRIERVGRPEVKNMMLAMKQFDPINRDLEIRDLYNMEDAFHLGDSYRGRLPRQTERQPRLLGRAGRKDRLGRRRKRRPSLDESRARRLPRRRPHEAVRRARLIPGDRARQAPGSGTRNLRRTGTQRRRDGHDLHPARQRGKRAHHPGRR